jgi:hypothetical protein
MLPAQTGENAQRSAGINNAVKDLTSTASDPQQGEQSKKGKDDR